MKKKNLDINSMKEIYRYFIAVIYILLLAGFTSCKKFLKIDPPKNDFENEVVFSSDVTATAAVLGIYNDMLQYGHFSNGSNTCLSVLSGLSSDELVNYPKQNSDDIQFEKNSLSPLNQYVIALWTSMYKTIYQANAALESLGTSTGITLSTKEQLKGEALFIRAFCHFYLVNLFGDVPFVGTTNYQVNSLVSRDLTADVYEHIVDDLITAQTLLNDSYVAAQSERIRPNNAAATALLARVYLYLEQWAEAETQASVVIGNASMYSLKNDLSEVFLKNSTEAIWQLRPITVTINDNGGTGEGYYFAPATILSYNILNEEIVESFEAGDLRKDDWVWSLDTVSTTIYGPNKYKQSESNTPITEYSMVLRVAEQYLIRAEARAMQNKLTGVNSAESDINAIRTRAGLLPTISSSQADLLDDIAQERKVELFTEWGHRWFDLKRWSKTNEVLGPIKGSDWQATDVLYPIPQTELNKNPNLTQNTGY